VSDQPAVRLGVLGPLEARGPDGTRLDLGGPRQRAVLAVLAIARGRVVATDRIIDDLWRGEPSPKAMGSLQAYVSHLRRALEPDRAARTPAAILVSASPGYALHLPEDAVDAWLFERLVREARVDADPASAAASLDRALGLWRGDAYAGFLDEDWAAPESARLSGAHAGAVESRAEAVLALGRAAEVVPDLERLVADQPLREDAWRLLALALYRTGRQGDALAALRRARVVLADELGVDPGPGLARTEADVLAQSPDLDWVAPTSGTVTAGPPRPPAAEAADAGASGAGETAVPAFVGRSDELAALAAAADRACEPATGGHVVPVLVAGDPGEGKTALLEAAARARAAAGWVVAWGRCPEVEGAPPAWPWAELLRGLAQRVPPDPELAQNLAPLLDDGAARPTGPDAVAQRFYLHRAVGRYLAAVSESAPLLVVVDDVHRADPESLDLLTAVAAVVESHRVVLVAAYRGQEVGPGLTAALAVLARHAPVRLQLGGLDADEVAELVGSLSDGEVDQVVAGAIAARTDGNPFYVRETARLLASEGELVAIAEVPAGVRDVIRRRVARLPAHAQTVLRLAAVVGRDVDVDVLLGADDGDEDRSLDAVEAGVMAGLLVEPAAGRLRFAHALVRDTLYDDISRLRRSRLHARIADVMEAAGSTDYAGITHHLREAGSPVATAKAVGYAVRAAEQAESRSALAAAGDLWEQAIALHERLPDADPTERVELRIRVARAHGNSGSLRLRDALHRAIDEAAATGDTSLVARAVTAWDGAMTWSQHVYGQTDLKLLEWIAVALAEVPESDVATRSRLLACRALELEGSVDDLGLRSAREAVAMARTLPEDPTALAFALSSLLAQLRGPRASATRAEPIEELHAVANEHKLAGFHTLAHYLQFDLHLALGDVEAARFHAEVGRSAARRLHQRDAELANGFIEPLLALVTGDYDRAESAYDELLDEFTAMGAPQEGMRWACPFTVRHAQGRLAETVAATRPQAESIPDAGAPSLVRALLAAGEVDEARELWKRLPAQRPDEFWQYFTVLRAESAVLLGDGAAVSSAYDELLPFAGWLAGGEGAVFALGPLDATLGWLAEHLGRLDDARRHWAGSLELATRIGWPQRITEAEEALARLG
jgi:DNA-binding SARP family transcriptional activator